MVILKHETERFFDVDDGRIRPDIPIDVASTTQQNSKEKLAAESLSGSTDKLDDGDDPYNTGRFDMGKHEPSEPGQSGRRFVAHVRE